MTALGHNQSSERATFISDTQRPTYHRSNSSFLGFLPGPTRQQTSVDLSDDGRVAASGGWNGARDGGLVIVFDTETRKEIGRIAADQGVGFVDVSGDGSKVLAVDGAAVYLFDVARRTSTQLHVHPRDREDLTTVRFRPGDKQFIVTSTDGTAELWDLATDEPINVSFPATARAETPWADRVLFAPDGTLAILTPDGALTYVNPDTGSVLRQRSLQVVDSSTVQHLVISSDGTRLAGSVQQGVVYVWDLATGQLVGDATRRPATARGIAFSPTSPPTLAIAASDGTVSLYDLATESVIGQPLRGHGAGARAVAYSANGRYLATTADDGLVGLWGDNGGDGLLVKPTSAGRWFNDLSSDGSRMLVAQDGATEIRDAHHPERPGVPVVAPAGSSSTYQFTRFSADGTAVVALTRDDPPTVFVADGRTGVDTWQQPGPGSSGDFVPANAAISPDGRLVVAVSDDSARLRLWDTVDGRVVANARIDDIAPGVSNFGSSPDFTPDGQYIDISILTTVVRLRASDLGLAMRGAGADGGVQCLPAEVPGSNDVIGGGSGGRVHRWNMSTGQLVATGYSQDSSSTCNIAVSPDGSLVAATQWATGNVTLFDAATLLPIGRPISASDVQPEPRFTPDSTHLVGNGLFEAVEWDVDPASWEATACRAAGRNLTQAEWTEYLGAEPFRATCVQ